MEELEWLREHHRAAGLIQQYLLIVVHDVPLVRVSEDVEEPRVEPARLCRAYRRERAKDSRALRIEGPILLEDTWREKAANGTRPSESKSSEKSSVITLSNLSNACGWPLLVALIPPPSSESADVAAFFDLGQVSHGSAS